ncbi:MAG: ATP-dependent helicase, partial [Bacteroidetes bacterium]|nr:ATP-dependent helicase [Bacteroidota bacterium]
YDANQKDVFKDSYCGRFIYSILRIIDNADDYVAYRTILGSIRGVGTTTINSICDKIIANALNFKELFVNPLPINIFSTREISAINRVRAVIQTINTFTVQETINQRAADLGNLILANFSQNEVNDWNSAIANLPLGITLSELKEYLQTDSIDQKDKILASIFERLGIQLQGQQQIDRVKIMSFHTSKGLDAQIVFIPGLEEEVFPTNRTRNNPGLLLENARLMYVAITRAKASCIMSYCRRRSMFGKSTAMTASRFAINTGVIFQQQNNNSLTAAEVGFINNAIRDL